jgi:hypothetical protein
VAKGKLGLPGEQLYKKTKQEASMKLSDIGTTSFTLWLSGKNLFKQFLFDKY